MKKLICAFIVLLMCISLVSPALAAQTSFVPSIPYKDHPEIIGDAIMTDKDGNTIDVLDGDCLVITPVSEALNTPENERTDYEKLLVDVYEQLTEGTMELPLDEDMVIRDLFDASLICGDIHLDPNHVEELKKEGTYLELTFDIGIAPNTDVVVMTYIDGKWQKIVDVVNNGDGTVTCVFEDICPIAFCVKADSEEEPPYTGDDMNHDLLIWIVLLVGSVVTLAVLVLPRRKSRG